MKVLLLFAAVALALVGLRRLRADDPSGRPGHDSGIAVPVEVLRPGEAPLVREVVVRAPGDRRATVELPAGRRY